MNWIIKQYKENFLFYCIGAVIVNGLLFVANTEPVSIIFFVASSGITLISAYCFLTLWIVVRIIIATIFKEQKEK